ncbi:hypothetical protein LJC07_04760 [Christensenellaceae bacterium OttesenSCG-928-L17]|nr:hypothetical protein [Christensenellaceae bacterium OttesenSCG-928-L17]
MFQPKPEIYAALKELGYYCLQGAQATFSDSEVPAITFRIDNNSTDVDLDNKIASQSITATVDIWADESPTASSILTEVEEAMRALGYRLSYSADVPSPAGALYHIQCRFDTLR